MALSWPMVQFAAALNAGLGLAHAVPHLQCFVVFPGLLGIGGGMIVSPLLLELGVHPLVAAGASVL